MREVPGASEPVCGHSASDGQREEHRYDHTVPSDHAGTVTPAPRCCLCHSASSRPNANWWCGFSGHGRAEITSQPGALPGHMTHCGVCGTHPSIRHTKRTVADDYRV
jgi:hypothetical protein